MSDLVDQITTILWNAVRPDPDGSGCEKWENQDEFTQRIYRHMAERIEAELPRPDVDAVAEAMWLSEREGPWDRANNDQQKRYRELATAALGVSAWSAVPQEDT